MGLKSLLYMVSMLSAVFGAVAINPVIGLVGYLLSYNVNPLSFWWGYQVPGFLHRYAMIFSVSIMAGMVFHFSRLRFFKWFEAQEILMILYIGIMWISTFTGIPTDALGENVLKMTKVTLILLMASHLVTDIKYFNWVVWVYIFAAFISGFEIFSSDTVSYRGGRLDMGIGGSDFSEGNFLAAHYLMIMPWVGIKVLTGSWKVRLFCLMTTAFVVNTLILIESRGSFLAIGCGVIMTLFLSGAKFRKQILTLLACGAVGFIFLADASFWNRMHTIETDQSTMDRSAMGRIEAWKGAIGMFEDHPFGVGEGNYKRIIGDYVPQMAGRDTHNTFFRCLAELGIQGLAVLLLMVQNAFRMLSRIKKQLDVNDPGDQEFSLHILALRISLLMYLVTTMFLTHTYVEEFYWLLMLPLFLKRCFDNERYKAYTAAHPEGTA
ncbi:MAG: O-antigen ligase family protein [Desulfobacterales bacterium]|nr:O-antigen ligase family protein [Desulfobacterales bacterium]